MTNELIEKLIGKTCALTSGSFGTAITGEVAAVCGNWIEVRTKKGVQLINADFVVSVVVAPDKVDK